MYRIGSLLLLLTFTILPLRAQDSSSALDNIVSEFAAATDPAVVVQVSTPEESWTAVEGLADGEHPTAPSDRFRIASMSKTFVAVVALMLAEDGILNLDDPAHKWLPDEMVANIANLDTVTLRQLLMMRSGIDDYFSTEEFWDAVLADPTREWTAGDALEYVYGLPPLFAPDDEFWYSNTNYLLVQLILEKASGLPLHTLVRDKILDLLALKDTYTQSQEHLSGGFVNGYEDMDGDGEAEDVSGLNDGAGLGDGALISNAADLTTFYRALLQDQTLLSPAAMKELLTFQPDDVGGGYSLALASWESPYGEALGHSGAVSGFQSIGMYLPQYETIIIVLSGSADFDPEALALAAAETILDQ